MGDYLEAGERRDCLVNEVTNLEDLGKCFDLRAFPLPVRVGPWRHPAGHCWHCGGLALHVYMRIKPRSEGELFGNPRDESGKLELNTCTFVDKAFLEVQGNLKAVEAVRVAVKSMVLHEVYEALLFRGERIMDPHNPRTLPPDQPF